MPKDPPSVEVLIRHVTDAVRRAYADGYRQGELAAIDKVMNAVGSDHSVAPVATRVPDNRSTPPPAKGVGRVPGHYGQLIGLIRAAIMRSDHVGITKDAILAYCDQRGIDLTINQYRETLKRLTGGQEIVRRHGAYFTGPKFRRDLVDTSLALDFVPMPLKEEGAAANADTANAATE